VRRGRRPGPPGRFLAPASVRSDAGALVAASLLFAAVLAATAGPEAAPRARRSHLPTPAYADGAPPGFSGGFGEESCHACHFEADANLPPGRVVLTGLPDAFVPGERYPLTVTLTRPGMALGGFQLTARFVDDGAQAGALEGGPGEEARVAIARSVGVEYANQRRPGAAPVAPDTSRWTLVWTAPPERRAVRVHVAANAADYDESIYGDRVYTAAVDVTPAAP
jgi:hypothetical protein